MSRLSILLLVLALVDPLCETLDAQSEPNPSVRLPSATVGPWSVSASVGTRGVNVRVGSARKSRHPTATTRTSSTTSERAAAVRASRVLATADRYVGTPYVYGGTTPDGFDCSGFVQYVFRKRGVSLPRTASQQAHAGTRVRLSRDALRPGDLLLFSSDGDRVDHVGIYAGNDRFIHSSSSGGGVRYDDLSTHRGKWFASHHVATRRVIIDGAAFRADLVAALSAGGSQLDPPDHAPKP